MNKKNLGFTTKILHYNKKKYIEHGSIHKPIYNNVAFKYKNAKHIAEVFQGKQNGYRYGRQGNPTVSALEKKITLMENGKYTICFSTGMAAIAAIIQGLLIKNDHIISSFFLFGNTNSMFNTINLQGIKIDMVDATDIKNIKKKITSRTKIIFVETIANPRTQIADLKNIGKLCEKKNILYIVDNTITSPYLFQPKTVKASLIINSLTKSICGHGNTLGGSLTDTGIYNWKKFSNILNIYKKYHYSKWGIIQIRSKALRDFGASLSPESAYNISIGAETISLRQKKACKNALSLANMLNNEKNISKVFYPGLSTHPQHKLAKKKFKYFGNILSFELNKNIKCFEYLNKLKIAIIASNLGDNRTLVIPVAHTIYFEMGKKKRKKMGISESLIRVSVGIENIKDILYDFKKALNF